MSASDPIHLSFTRRDVLHALLVALLVAALNGLHCIRDPYFFWHDDFQTQYLGASFEIAEAWRHGEVPLLTARSWFAGALAGEYQYGVFSLFTTALNVAVWRLGLPLPLTAACLSLVNLAVTAAGAFLLGRSYRLSPPLSALVALVASSNGWLITWGAANWYPALASFAWIPWLWLGLRGLVARVSMLRVALSALALYCVLSAGWPFTCVMAMLITVLHLGPLTYHRRFRSALAITGAVTLGVGLAAPSFLTLIEYLFATARSSSVSLVEYRWELPREAVLGLILPSYSSPWWLYGPPIHAAVELAGGLVPLAGLVAAVAVLRFRFVRSHVAEVCLLVVTFVLARQPTAGMFRYSFRWLPLFHLALALLGALGLQAIQEERRHRLTTIDRRSGWNAWAALNSGGWALLLILLALLIAAVRDHHFDTTARLATLYVFFTGLWIVVEERGTPRAVALFPPLFAVVVLFSVFSFVPGDQAGEIWRITDEVRAPAPYRPDVRYMAVYRGDDIMREDRKITGTATGHPLFRPGNLPMLARLSFINGYSPMQPRGLRELLGLRDHGYVTDEAARRLLEKEAGRGGLLEHLGVDGLVLHESLAQAIHVDLDHLDDWKRVASIDGEVLLERPRGTAALTHLISTARVFLRESEAFSWVNDRPTSGLPFFLVDPQATPGLRAFCGAGDSTPVSAQRLSTVVDVAAEACATESLLLVRRPWVPGYRARSRDGQLPVVVVDLMMPAVVLPPHFSGAVIIEYRPWTLSVGIGLALASLVVVAALAVAHLRPRARDQRYAVPTG